MFISKSILVSLGAAAAVAAFAVHATRHNDDANRKSTPICPITLSSASSVATANGNLENPVGNGNDNGNGKDNGNHNGKDKGNGTDPGSASSGDAPTDSGTAGQGATSAWLPPGNPIPPPPAPAPTDGSYKLFVRGSYNGMGKAIIANSTITIFADVRGPDGTRFTFQTPVMPLQDKSFSAPGTVGNFAATFSGRIDPADNIGSGPTSAAVFCTFSTFPGGPSGRIAGFQTP